MKKIISMLLVLTMLMTFMWPVMAAGSTTSADNGLEKAIKVVKEKINIPADLKKFSYNIYNQNGNTAWNLSWSNEEQQKYMSVTIDGNNLITNYSFYNYSVRSYDKKIPKFSKEQGLEIAEKFVKKLDAKILGEFKLVENNSTAEREYNFNYIRQHSGLNYSNNSLSISVNNYTGEVTNYNLSYSKDTQFEDASKIISLEQAKKAFMEKLGLKLVYNTKYEKNKIVTYLAYVPKDSNKYIDALTGNVETNTGRYGIAYTETAAMSMKMAAEDAANGGVVLTPEEIDAVKSLSGLLTKDDVDKKLRSTSLLGIDSEFKLTNSELRRDWRSEDTLIWSLYYTKVIDKDKNQTRETSAQVDAKTGDLLGFYTYYQSPEGTKGLKTKEEAKSISENALKALMPAKFNKVKYDDTYSSYEDPNQSQFTFRYVRVENGVEFPYDYVTISYDNLSGNIVNINSNWTNNVKFDDPKKTISLDKAYEVLFGKIGYGVEYTSDYNTVYEKIIIEPIPTKDSGKAVLGYFINNNRPNIIDALTGNILNYDGAAYKENITSDYTDLKGLSSENKVKILTQLGIRYNENELKANDSVLQKDYFLLLCKLNDLYYFNTNSDDATITDRMYEILIGNGIITKEEKAPLATLTREDAAKYFVKFLRLGQVAEIKGIFKSDFKDANKISPDLLGYVCITSGLKAMNGSNGYFYPKNKFTRLEALLSIYSYLENK